MNIKQNSLIQKKLKRRTDARTDWTGFLSPTNPKNTHKETRSRFWQPCRINLVLLRARTHALKLQGP